MKNDDRYRIEATIRGHVQGVVYRGTTANEAKKHSVTGWVRNNANGTVSAVAEGSKSDLEAFLKYLHEGPPAARVTGVDVVWKRATSEFDSFNVRYV